MSSPSPALVHKIQAARAKAVAELPFIRDCAQVLFESLRSEGPRTSEFKEAMDKLGLIPEIAPRYRVTYFNHIIGGYAAGYYSYLWANVLDNDAFEAFKEHGIFDKNTADLFRHNVLEKGDSEDPMVLYRNFRGAEPSLEPLLKNRGMK